MYERENLMNLISDLAECWDPRCHYEPAKRQNPNEITQQTSAAGSGREGSVPNGRRITESAEHS